MGVDDQAGVLPDFDSRAAVAPTDAQVAAANAVADEVQWDRFGTPSSLVNPGGFLAEKVQGKDATAAARAWLESNKALYKLSSTDELEVATSGALAGTDTAYAVVFRQVLDGLSSADGAVSISLQKAGGSWNVVYASSTLTGEEALTNEVQLAPAEALAEAASESGEDVSVAELDAQRVESGWREFKAKGLKGDQAVRKVAFPTSKHGVRVAYEAIVMTESAPGVDQQYRTIVDAENGNLLMRQSLTDNAVDNPKWDVFPAWPQTTSMNQHPWNYPSADVRDLWCWFPAPGLPARGRRLPVRPEHRVEGRVGQERGDQPADLPDDGQQRRHHRALDQQRAGIRAARLRVRAARRQPDP